MSAPERTPRVPKARPDPAAMRLLLGVSGLVAVTALATAVVRPTAPAMAPVPTDPGPYTPPPPPLVVRHVTRYVQLQPGETPPQGATVVQKPAASPRVVVVTLPAPAPRQVVVVTRQSGVP